jgi:hypothetical protein
MTTNDTPANRARAKVDNAVNTFVNTLRVPLFACLIALAIGWFIGDKLERWHDAMHRKEERRSRSRSP